MPESQEFGLLREIRIKQKTGFGERDMKTYALDKRQSIAVAGRSQGRQDQGNDQAKGV